MRIRLEDGTPMRLRPARPADSGAVLAMHGRLSKTSLFFRYLGAYRPTRKDIDAICRLRGHQGLAIVAETMGSDPEVAGLAYMVVEQDRLRTTAEPAVVVEDRFHGQGLGRRLFEHLCRLARKNKVEVLHTYIHKENRKMLGILKRLEYPVIQTCHSGTVLAEIVLAPGDGIFWQPPELGGLAAAECF